MNAPPLKEIPIEDLKAKSRAKAELNKRNQMHPNTRPVNHQPEFGEFKNVPVAERGQKETWENFDWDAANRKPGGNNGKKGVEDAFNNIWNLPQVEQRGQKDADAPWEQWNQQPQPVFQEGLNNPQKNSNGHGTDDANKEDDIIYKLEEGADQINPEDYYYKGD